MSDETALTDEYAKLVDESAETRARIDDELHSRYGLLKKLFLEVTGLSGGILKRYADLQYYQGGYPSENTPPKEVQLADEIAGVMKMCGETSRRNLIDLLAERGVTIDSSGLDVIYTQFADDQLEKVEELWNKAFKGEDMPTSRRDIFHKIVEATQPLQSEICTEADTIKIDAAAIAEEKHKIKKGNFIKTVKVASIEKRKNKAKMKQQLEKVVENAENLEKALEPLKK